MMGEVGEKCLVHKGLLHSLCKTVNPYPLLCLHGIPVCNTLITLSFSIKSVV